MKPLDLSALVRNIRTVLEVPVPRETGLKYQLDCDIPEILGNAHQICRMVLNLVLNAADAVAQNGGTITVRSGATRCDREYLTGTHMGEGLPEGDYGYLEVSDDGCGIEPEVRERMFELFFTTKRKGYGLGLTYVSEIVRRHGGALEVESEPGRGARVRVLFPSVGVAARAPDVPSHEDSQAKIGEKADCLGKKR